MCFSSNNVWKRHEETFALVRVARTLYLWSQASSRCPVVVPPPFCGLLLMFHYAAELSCLFSSPRSWA